MSFTLIGSHAAMVTGSGTQQVFIGNITNVQAGDLLVALVGNHDGGATPIAVGDTSSLFTHAGTEVFDGDTAQFQMHYLLSSVATGSVTYGAEWTEARSNRMFAIFHFRPSAPVTFGGFTSATGASSSSASSGPLTVIGSDILAFGGEASTTSNHASFTRTIGGIAADGFDDAPFFSGFFRTTSSSFTGSADTTYSGNANWAALFGYFRIGAGPQQVSGTGSFTGPVLSLAQNGSGLAGTQQSVTGTGAQSIALSVSQTGTGLFPQVVENIGSLINWTVGSLQVAHTGGGTLDVVTMPGTGTFANVLQVSMSGSGIASIPQGVTGTGSYSAAFIVTQIGAGFVQRNVVPYVGDARNVRRANSTRGMPSFGRR